MQFKCFSKAGKGDLDSHMWRVFNLYWWPNVLFMCTPRLNVIHANH